MNSEHRFQQTALTIDLLLGHKGNETSQRTSTYFAWIWVCIVVYVCSTNHTLTSNFVLALFFHCCHQRAVFTPLYIFH